MKDKIANIALSELKQARWLEMKLDPDDIVGELEDE